MNIRDKISKAQYEDLYHRHRTVREIARELGVTENYLTHAIPERAPKKNYKLLKATRLLYHEQLAREVVANRLSAKEAAEKANLTLRTMYRRIEKVRNVLP